MLRLSRQDVDLDQLILRVHGKGNNQQLVPMSIRLRKVLYRHMAKNEDRLLLHPLLRWLLLAQVRHALYGEEEYLLASWHQKKLKFPRHCGLKLSHVSHVTPKNVKQV